MKLLLSAAFAGGLVAGADGWSEPVEVLHQETRCLTYRATVSGDLLIVEARIEPGWHTFSMDNKKRAEEKLAGRPSLGIDQPTEVKPLGGLEVTGPWRQSPPKDFSKPELRWFSWGFEQRAMFAAKVRRAGGAPARIGIRGQACTETTCKNIDVEVAVPAVSAGVAEVELKSLTAVR